MFSFFFSINTRKCPSRGGLCARGRGWNPRTSAPTGLPGGRPERDNTQRLFFCPISKWRMTPVLREGPEAPEGPEWEAAAASAEVSALVSEAVGAGVDAAVDGAAGLEEERPKTRRQVWAQRAWGVLMSAPGGPGNPPASFPQWIPVTKLGRLVKDMKIKSLEEIYLFSLPIKVPWVLLASGWVGGCSPAMHPPPHLRLGVRH